MVKGKPSGGENSALCKLSKSSIFVPILEAIVWKYRVIFRKLQERLSISMLYLDRVIPSFHLRGRGEQSFE